MAVASGSAERIDFSHTMDRSSSKSASEAASESSSTAALSCSVVGTPDRNDPSNSSPNPHEVQSPASLRSEEYRQLFRLPPEEVLIEDFNCAFQENILIQGHMYLFVHYVCFYSNIFGFETKKIIPFSEVTIVRRAKTAGIFPNAIEIFAGGKKFFFASFLSRDEAFKLINDGWLQNNTDAKSVTEHQESISESSNQENGVVVIENVKSFEFPANELDSTERNGEPSILRDTLPVNVEDDIGSPTFSEQQDNVEQDAEPVLNDDSSSSKTTWTWRQENIDAPKIPEFFTKVAESKFLLKVEDFFSIFLSDDAIDFSELFRKKCGDKDYRCSSWYPHERFGHARDVSFQHPIKIYFGAKFGSCQEIQKFRVYRNSHLVMETSQEVSDVPYSDYFRVEGLWDLEREVDESEECCILRIYVNVAFSKRTVWKGKIVQSTIEECQEAYTTWINMAHELLKQKNVEKKEERGPAASMIQDGEVHIQSEAKTGESSERLLESSDRVSTQQVSDSMDVNQQVGNHLRGNSVDVTSVASWLRESIVRLGSSLKSQNHISVLAVIIFAVILLMQLSIVVLLARPQHIHVSPQADYLSGVGGRSSDAMAWMEKRIHHLKDEMYMVESRLERMRHEHALLKAQLKDFEDLSKQR